MSFFDEDMPGDRRYPPRPPRSRPKPEPSMDYLVDKHEGQTALIEIVMKPVAAFIAYKLYRRWGAPKWAAHGIVAITATLNELRETPEKREQRVEKAAEYVASFF